MADVLQKYRVAAIRISWLEGQIKTEKLRWPVLTPIRLAESKVLVEELERKIEEIEQDGLPIVGGKPMDWDEVEMDHALRGLRELRKEREAEKQKKD